MGGESSSSPNSSSLESGESSAMGSQRELINIRGAQLYLIDGEESVLMTSGEFSLKLLKQANSPLALAVASVGDVQWPVGKDAPVLKVWNRRYTFALPGLEYGMMLPDSIPIAVLHHFEAILTEFSTFEIRHEIANAVQFAISGGRDDPGFWTAVAPEVHTLSSRVARNIDSTSNIVASSIVVGGDWAALGIKHGAALMKRKIGPESTPGGGDGWVSRRMMERMQRARRMSAVAKLMSRTLLKGAISATGHVSRSLELVANAPSTAAAYGSSDETARNVAVASVDAFGKVVEAVETAGKSLYDVTQKVGTDIVQERFGLEAGQVVQDGFGAVGNVINTAWTLNKMGVKMLLRMTAASTALSTRPGNSRSTASTVTDDQSFSSPTSFASTPMKQQRSPPQTLQHEISLPSQQVAQSVPLHLLSPANVAHSGQQLHTSQLFPTSAEQMRNHLTVGLAAPSPVFMSTGNYTGIMSVPASRSNSPFQQYHRHVQAPFSFQPARANMQIE